MNYFYSIKNYIRIRAKTSTSEANAAIQRAIVDRDSLRTVKGAKFSLGRATEMRLYRINEVLLFSAACFQILFFAVLFQNGNG